MESLRDPDVRDYLEDEAGAMADRAVRAPVGMPSVPESSAEETGSVRMTKLFSWRGRLPLLPRRYRHVRRREHVPTSGLIRRALAGAMCEGKEPVLTVERIARTPARVGATWSSTFRLALIATVHLASDNRRGSTTDASCDSGFPQLPARRDPSYSGPAG